MVFCCLNSTANMGPLRLFAGDREGRLEHKEHNDGTPVP